MPKKTCILLSGHRRYNFSGALEAVASAALTAVILSAVMVAAGIASVYVA